MAKKILVISDSHGKKNRLKRLVKSHKDADMLIHLGDCTADMTGIASKYGGEIVMVCGNSDHHSSYPLEHLLTLDGVRILVTHGHKYKVKWSLVRLDFAAMEKNVHVVLFGHTHIPMVDHDGRTLFVNPGSLYGGSYGILTIDGGIANATIHNLKDK